MKRVGYLFEKVTDIENIKLAIRNASRGKRKRKCVQRALADIDGTALRIQQMLLSGTYVPSPYKSFNIEDGPRKKARTIYCPEFYPDQIIHWAIMLVMEPIFSKSMYEFSCGSVPNRGVHYGKKHIERWLRRDPINTRYCLKIDIKKYYPHIDQDTLMQKFNSRIKDKRMLNLVSKIVYSHDAGLPIGNYTSQWWANFYLEATDHFIKETLHTPYYVRYMDDMVLFASSAEELRETLHRIKEHLTGLKLEIKDNWQIFLTDSRPLDFMGFKFYRTHTTLRRSNSLRIRRRAVRIYQKGKIVVHDARAFLSYWGWIICSNSFKFYMRYIRPYVDITKLKEVIGHADRKQYQTKRARSIQALA